MLLSIQRNHLTIATAVSLFFFLSLPYGSSAQKEAEGFFILRGNTRTQAGKGVEGVDLELKKDGKTIQKLLSGKNGKYLLKMDISILKPKNEYLLLITHPGMASKSISINTYINPEEYQSNTFPSYQFDLEIKLTETKEKDIILVKPSARIFWDNEQHGFGFDQTFLKIKEDDTEKLLAEKKKREEEEAARKRAEAEARMIAELDAREEAERKAKEEAERIVKNSLEAAKKELRRKRIKDSLDSIAVVTGNATVNIKALSSGDVDPNAFDGTSAYSINIAKRTLKAEMEKMNKEKAANLSAKYETNNTLTSLLNMVDEYEKNIKHPAKSIKQ